MIPKLTPEQQLHLDRMYFDAYYKYQKEQEKRLRQVKAEFLERICEALEHNPYAEFLQQTFREEVCGPDQYEG